MFGKWYQLYIREYENGTSLTPHAAGRIDDHISRYGALFYRPEKNGLPISNCGEYEIRVLNPDALRIVKSILRNHYGVRIGREVENE
jgi:hypothetical protein